MGVGDYLSPGGHGVRGMLVGTLKFLTRACGEEPAGWLSWFLGNTAAAHGDRRLSTVFRNTVTYPSACRGVAAHPLGRNELRPYV